MRVYNVDGLVTLYYDGSKKLFNQELYEEWEAEFFNNVVPWEWEAEFFINVGEIDEDWTRNWESWNLSDECKKYWRERLSWQQIIVVEGVNVIPENTFIRCRNIEKVIFANTDMRIGIRAFYYCENLVFIKWSLNLRRICESAFQYCNLSSIFIPPRCRYIGDRAFFSNKNLEILNVPQDTQLNQGNTIGHTKLLQTIERSDGDYNEETLIKNINNGEKFALHRVCASFEPTLEMILDTMKDKGGPKAFKVENIIGITPSRYLKENPYAHVKEKEIIEKYVMDMMGEHI